MNLFRTYGFRQDLKKLVKASNQHLGCGDTSPTDRLLHLKRRNKASKLLLGTDPWTYLKAHAKHAEMVFDIHFGPLLTHHRSMDKYKKRMKDRYNVVIN